MIYKTIKKTDKTIQKIDKLTLQIKDLLFSLEDELRVNEELYESLGIDLFTETLNKDSKILKLQEKIDYLRTKLSQILGF